MELFINLCKDSVGIWTVLLALIVVLTFKDASFIRAVGATAGFAAVVKLVTLFANTVTRAAILAAFPGDPVNAVRTIVLACAAEAVVAAGIAAVLTLLLPRRKAARS